LTSAQFAAVPDHLRLDATRNCLLSERIDFEPAAIRERPHRIHVGTDRISVMDEVQQGYQSSTRKGVISANVGCVSSRRPIFTP
jgi:hypothetical protein